MERLESLVAAGKKVPLTNNIVLDQATVLELIDQLRVSVPDEVRQARRITEEAGRITERAREEGDAIVARAQEQAAQMLEERELVRAAQQRATEIIEQAQSESREVRRGADEYAAGVLIRLEGECIKALTSIKRGIDMLDERHRPAATDGASPDASATIEVDPEEQARAASRP
ncbi:MAG TPA: ATPase [Candidatus Limnocylindria bacterium]